MLFTTDRQTIEDLNIFGKHSSSSIYNLFNRTSTRGGAELLEEMFLYPLSEPEAINKRSGIIKYFSITSVFPFDTGYFDVAEAYLANIDERTKLLHDGDKIIKKIGNLIAEESDYKFISAGVTALIEIINALKEFTDSLVSASFTAYHADLEVILDLLAFPEFDALFDMKRNSRLAYSKLAELDGVLRFKYSEKIKTLLHYIYQLDVYISVGKIAIERGFIFPKALPSGKYALEINGLYHPELAKPVANDFKITPEANIVFLTGANMAGKSTFMKSVGIALYLAHMGFPVAAIFMEFGVMDGIYTTINLPDDLLSGISHFYAEVLRIKKIAKELASAKKLFIIFDELFRGTNVKDAFEGTVAITEAFATRHNSMFMVSTHIVEAAEILEERCDKINFIYLPTSMQNNKPIYSYHLEQGVTADRHGMVIINNEGILEIIRSRINRTI